MDFDGTSDRVFIPDNTLFQLTTNLTLEAFIKPRAPGSGTANFAQIIFRGDARAGLDPYFLALKGGDLFFHIEDLSTSDDAEIQAPLPSLNQWLHIAGVLDDATNEMRLYIDGNLVAMTTTSIRPGGVLTGSEPGLGIGDVQRAGNQYFDGLIDEVRISDVALLPHQFLNIPEPSRALLSLLGLGAMLVRRRRTSNVRTP